VTKNQMEQEIGEIRDSVAILRVGLQTDLEKSLDLVGGAGGQLENIHEALQVLLFAQYQCNDPQPCADRKGSGILV
jgi:hypothetical protein